MVAAADRLPTLQREALESLATSEDERALEAWRVRILGRRGELTTVLRGLGQLPLDERPRAGAEANRVKRTLEAAFDQRLAELRQRVQQQELEGQQIDVSLPGRPLRVAQPHLVNQVWRQIQEIFSAMGFQTIEGPEVEYDRYNFALLNMPPEHPARDMWDTLYIENVGQPGEVLLRTHTSPNQIRVMERMQPPLRVIVPGKCYRYEQVDATHEWQLTQVEGFAVDRNVTLADLKGVLTYFARAVFGEDRRVRLRCDYFPFVEPGAEMALDCHVCGGAGCGVCKDSGWIEILGAGMIHPVVLKNVGYDPTEWTGFAFGMGIERIAMLKYGVDDIRRFYGNDLRFLRQFR